jgi:hypothetical protein
VTVAELVEKLTELQAKTERPMPVLVYDPEMGGFVNAEAHVENEGKPRPYVVIA